jgi:hypothetical protein
MFYSDSDVLAWLLQTTKGAVLYKQQQIDVF